MSIMIVMLILVVSTSTAQAQGIDRCQVLPTQCAIERRQAMEEAAKIQADAMVQAQRREQQRNALNPYQMPYGRTGQTGQCTGVWFGAQYCQICTMPNGMSQTICN